jgi:hypothetical protein
MNDMMYNIKDVTKEGVEHFFKTNLVGLSTYIKGLKNLTYWQMYHIYDKCLKDTSVGTFILPSSEFFLINDEHYFFQNYEYDNIKEFKNHINELSKTDNKTLLLIATIGFIKGENKIYLRGRVIEDYKEYDCEEFKKHFNNRRKSVINNLLDSV